MQLDQAISSISNRIQKQHIPNNYNDNNVNYQSIKYKPVQQINGQMNINYQQQIQHYNNLYKGLQNKQQVLNNELHQIQNSIEISSAHLTKPTSVNRYRAVNDNNFNSSSQGIKVQQQPTHIMNKNIYDQPVINYQSVTMSNHAITSGNTRSIQETREQNETELQLINGHQNTYNNNNNNFQKNYQNNNINSKNINTNNSFIPLTNNNNSYNIKNDMNSNSMLLTNNNAYSYMPSPQHFLSQEISNHLNQQQQKQQNNNVALLPLPGINNKTSPIENGLNLPNNNGNLYF